MSQTTAHKEGKARVKVVYFISKTLSDGSHPFVLRISKGKDRKHISTGLSLHPKYWNAEKQEVRRSYPEPQREKLLLAIRQWEAKYADAATGLAEADEAHAPTDVAARAVEKRATARPTKKLLAYIDELAAQMRNSGQVGNATVYIDLKNQLHKYILSEYPQAGGDIHISAVSVNFCNEWEATLRATGVTEITLSLRFRTLRAVLNKAIAAGLAKAETYPFARTVAERQKFQVGKFDVSTAKRAISREDVRRLEALAPGTERHRLAKDVFLFSFYVGGINFVDLAQLRWQDLSGADAATGHPQRLNYVRQKTGGKFALKLLAPAAAIVAAYRPFTHATPQSYVFPILDGAKHITPTQAKNRMHKILGQVNTDLKELGEMAGIAAPLTTYVARHSFATALKISGAPMGVISQSMGHKSESVTAIYLDSFASETMDAAFDGLL